MRARRAEPAAVDVLVKACTLAGLVCAGLTAVPFSATASRTLTAVLAVVAIGLATALRLVRERCPAVALHAVLALATALIGFAVARSTTDAGAGVTSVAFVWVGAFTATFDRRPVVLGHLALCGTALAVGLRATGAPAPVQTWFFVMATTVGVAWLLNDKVGRLRAEATEDLLTGTLSRRRFLELTSVETARAARSERPVTLVLLDLDDFKRVNDEGGHAAGDRVLVALTEQWRSSLRLGDALGRLGGDEFALLLPDTDASTARIVVERMRALGGTPWTAGVAEWTGEPVEEWIGRADDDLYAGKSARRR